MGKPTRPVLRWFGGKWRLAPWIISHFPSHRVYVEPFGGAGSVLMRKERAYAEIWNDLDGEVVNLFQVLRSDDAAKLVELITLTPFAHDEYRAAYDITDDPVERARRLIVRAFMGFGSNAVHAKSGFRANSNRSGTTPSHDWDNYPPALTQIVERLRGVVICNGDAVRIMEQHDNAETLHYVDPPYVHSTRGEAVKNAYSHEMDNDQHGALLDALCEMRGMVVLSGYPHPIYDEALQGWERVEREALADGARKRTEVLWLNPQCSKALDLEHIPMFAEASNA
jgi:DNA adenine methylase